MILKAIITEDDIKQFIETMVFDSRECSIKLVSKIKPITVEFKVWTETED